jgi:hypothetical protein
MISMVEDEQAVGLARRRRRRGFSLPSSDRKLSRREAPRAEVGNVA